jgi:hypothetical protein
MTWRGSPGFERRPLVFVEDHLYHTGEVVAAIAATNPDLLRDVTVCAIDRAGPDTDATVGEWLARYPELQIAAATSGSARLKTITGADLASTSAFAKLVASLLRPGGVLVQDVQLSTLAFVPADRWWESIYVAATVRGLFASAPPAVRFMSNKRGYAATFGRDLVDAGFDPRDVLDKSEMVTVGMPSILALFARRCPLVLDVTPSGGGSRAWRVGEVDRAEIEAQLDLVLWPALNGAELGGRLVRGADRRVLLRAGSHETATWDALIADRLSSGDGLPVVDVGERVGPPDAERAELTNVAARHLHTLRSRLADGGAIATARHAYRLADGLGVGRVRRDP